MQSSLKDFPCLNHPDEKVQRLTFDPHATKNLYCISCLVEAKPQGNVYSFHDYLKKFINYQNSRKTPVDQQQLSEIPDETQIVLAKKDKMLSSLREHIEQEKLKIHSFFDHWQQKILSLIERKRSEALNNLEEQFAIMNSNFDQIQFKMKLLTEHTRIYKDIDDLFMTINKFSSTQELKKFIQFLNSQVSDLHIHEDLNIPKRSQDLIEAVNSINWVENSWPSASCPNREQHGQLIVVQLEGVLGTGCVVSNPIVPLNLNKPLSSKIFDTYGEVKQISDWIRKEKPVELKRMYQGTLQHGLNNGEIIQAFSKAQNLLFLVKTALDEKIGVFTNLQFNNPKFEGKRMLFFNLSKETKFTSSRPLSCFNNCAKGNLIKFGGELTFSVNYEGTEGNFAGLNEFSVAWKDGVKTLGARHLTSNPHFKVKDVEVYCVQVEFNEDDDDKENVLQKVSSAFEASGMFGSKILKPPLIGGNGGGSGMLNQNQNPKPLFSGGGGSSGGSGLFQNQNPKPLFGSSGLVANPKPSGTGLFGSNSNSSVAAGGGGSTASTSKPSGPGLFKNLDSGGLFGNPKPAGGGLFGSKPKEGEEPSVLGVRRALWQSEAIWKWIIWNKYQLFRSRWRWRISSPEI